MSELWSYDLFLICLTIGVSILIIAVAACIIYGICCVSENAKLKKKYLHEKDMQTAKDTHEKDMQTAKNTHEKDMLFEKNGHVRGILSDIHKHERKYRLKSSRFRRRYVTRVITVVMLALTINK